MKPGYATTELWLSVIAVVLTAGTHGGPRRVTARMRHSPAPGGCS